MKALTVCQPYAHLIASGRKRVENREWPTSYRGLLYIHAGKNRSWLDEDNYGIALDRMAFGAVVALARLVDCLHIEAIDRGDYDQKYPWLRDHEHTEGTWCWVLDGVSPIGPWPWRGSQGLFDINESELESIANRQLGIAQPSSADCREA